MSQKKPSAMTPDEFVYQVGLLGGEYKRVAFALNKSQACISLYASGRARITEAVRDRMDELVRARKAELERYVQRPIATLADMLQAVNEIRQNTSVPEAPKLPGRENPPDARTYPLYRMHTAKLRVYLTCLRSWAEHIANLYRRTQDTRALNQYKLELADLKNLIAAARACLQGGAPYELCITYTEWQVVSRALRALGTKEAYALYQHWRVHRDTGWPLKREIPLHEGVDLLSSPVPDARGRVGHQSHSSVTPPAYKPNSLPVPAELTDEAMAELLAPAKPRPETPTEGWIEEEEE